MIEKQRGSHQHKHQFPADQFADLMTSNEAFAAGFGNHDLPGQAKRGLAVITCMDSRIDPLALLGLEAGDAKIMRNAGARVTEDTLRTLVLATYLLNVSRVLVMPHTNCKMASATEEQIRQSLLDEFGVDTRSLEFRVAQDQQAALATDLARIRSYPLLPAGLTVGGAMYDVHTGRLTPVDS